jgi:predicted phosphodiesterase
MIKEFFEKPSTPVVGDPTDPNTYLYKLNENGLIIHRVYVDVGLEEEKNILLLSDIHLSNWNLKDFEEKNPVILETIDKRRSTFKREDTFLNIERIMNYAGLFDKVIVAGDSIDYLTWGALDYIQRYIYNKCPSTLVLLGNHDAKRVIGHAMPDPSTLESREKMLKTVIKTDIHYHSEIIGEKVLIIGLNNGQEKYTTYQYERLLADIKIAREKSLSVLIFQHEPICTYNENEKEVTPIYMSSPGSYWNGRNFCDHSGRIGSPNSDEVTMQAYRLITDNADIIKGVFCGHWHNEAYTQIVGSYMENGNRVEKFIPQYVNDAAAYDNGHVMIITLR